MKIQSMTEETSSHTQSSTTTESVATPIEQIAQESPSFEHIRTLFIGTIAAFVIVFIVWGGITLASQAQEKQVQKEYLTINSTASGESFAKMHLEHPLGGLVLLKQADEYYTNGNYAAAKSAYEKVVSSGLKSQPALAEQAILGAAFSSYYLNPDKGLQELKGVAENTALTQSSRAYVATELAGYYAQKGLFKQAKDYLQLVKTMKSAAAWQSQGETLAQIYPELAEKSPEIPVK
jgi:tetratricopeptide (TPR) repeat protein